MKKRTSRKQKPETLMRFIDITSISAGTSFSAGQERGDAPHISTTARVEMTGTMNEPVRQTRDVEIVVYAADDPKSGAGPPPWIGLVHGVRPVMHAAVFLPDRVFDRLWSLALSGLLKHAHIFLTPPRYQSAYVLNFSFSTQFKE